MKHPLKNIKEKIDSKKERTNSLHDKAAIFVVTHS